MQARFSTLPGSDRSWQAGLSFSDQEIRDPPVYAPSVALEKAAVGSFLSQHVPELKGAATAGRTLNDALGKKPLNGNVDSLPADPFEKAGEQRDVEFAADDARKLRCPSDHSAS